MKKIYISPDVHVVAVGAQSLLAGSYTGEVRIKAATDDIIGGIGKSDCLSEKIQKPFNLWEEKTELNGDAWLDSDE